MKNLKHGNIIHSRLWPGHSKKWHCIQRNSNLYEDLNFSDEVEKPESMASVSLFSQHLLLGFNSDPSA